MVGVAHGDVRNAFTAAWVMQVSFDPLLLALSINPHHASSGLLKESRAFSVNVLKKGQLEVASGRLIFGSRCRVSHQEHESEDQQKAFHGYDTPRFEETGR